MHPKRIIRPVGTDIVIYQYGRLLSSNAYLKDQIGFFSPWAVVWADEQTAGHGRFSRAWHMVPGRDLAFSILVPLAKLKTESWPCITLVAALAVARACDRLAISTRIKWPNDILINGSKVCGILTESICRGPDAFAVVGIGLNLNSRAKSHGVTDRPVTTIHEIIGDWTEPQIFLLEIVRNFRALFDLYVLEGFPVFVEEYNSRLAQSPQPSRISMGDRELIGRITHVNDDGSVRIIGEDGSEFDLVTGEIMY